MTDLNRPAEAFQALHAIIATLRGPNGCPWDREQTHASLRRYLIEESYETLEALDSGDLTALREELGDLLLQIMLHTQIASEAGEFDVTDVIDGLSAKMIRRHPHVFGTESVQSSADVVRNWDAIKAEEKGLSAAPASVLDGVPRNLPALIRALEISKRAVRVGFEWQSLSDVFSKVREEIDELEVAASESGERAADEIGDLLFTIVNVARWMHVDPEEALRQMVRRFTERFQHMERQASEQDRTLNELSLDDMEELWRNAKRALNPHD